jgi:hypothetical protein
LLRFRLERASRRYDDLGNWTPAFAGVAATLGNAPP